MPHGDDQTLVADRWLTIADACVYTQLSKATLYAAARSGGTGTEPQGERGLGTCGESAGQ